MDNWEHELFNQMCIEDETFENRQSEFTHYEDALEDLIECENLYNDGLWC